MQNISLTLHLFRAVSNQISLWSLVVRSSNCGSSSSLYSVSNKYGRPSNSRVSSTLLETGKSSAMTMKSLHKTPNWSTKWPALLWCALSHCRLLSSCNMRAPTRMRLQNKTWLHRAQNKWRVREMLCMVLSETCTIAVPWWKQALLVGELWRCAFAPKNLALAHFWLLAASAQNSCPH